MIFAPLGQNLISGIWTSTRSEFRNEPASGEAISFYSADADLVDDACRGAEDAFWSYGYVGRASRAAFLRAIAEEIERRADAITDIGTRETGLPRARLEGERGRTTAQLRLFADTIEDTAYLDIRYDDALPDRQPLPRPDIRMMQRPIGPVAIFGASNFPLAFSVAGGDTAAALAAGCPVVVRGHPAHPGTSEIVAQAILAAIERLGVHPGVFSLLQGGGNAVGSALVQHPLIKAVGFTGSLSGGRALFDLCAQRAEPIPFFGELGSVNPMFVLPAALKARAAELGKGWAASMTGSAGQLCTNPGIAVVPEGHDGDAFVRATVEALGQVGPQVMLTEGIASAFRAGKARFDSRNSAKALYATAAEGRTASPALYEISADAFLEDHALADEVFGPLSLVVRAASAEAMIPIARGLAGQLTATLQMASGDEPFAAELLPILERKAGRILVNGFPTGVEVVGSMVHGGPYPASTNFGATSVGTMSIRRFLRPVAYQNIPAQLLPEDLRG